MTGSRARIESIAHDDSGVELISLVLESPFRFRAGQYLEVLHPGGKRIPMSIASAPERLPKLSLHFRPLRGVPEAALMHELLTASDTLLLEGPFGDVHVEGPVDHALLLMAGGSGISQCRSIVEHLDLARQSVAVNLVWSVTRADQLYCNAELQRFARWLRYFPVVDGPSGNAAVEWVRTNDVLDARRIVVSGGPGFVYAVVDALVSRGVDRRAIESDVFAYAPR